MEIESLGRVVGGGGGVMLVGRKYRLAFTPEQGEMAEEFGNICRAVWNTGLEQPRGSQGVETSASAGL